MPDPAFFARLGLFVRNDFLDATECEQIVSEMRAAARSLASVRTTGSNYEVVTSVRSARWVEVSPQTVALAEERLQGVLPAIERHFSVKLQGIQPPQFLAYQEGDFYSPHRDDSRDGTAAEFQKARRISVVIFLNSHSEELREGSYCGGFLTLYGLLQDRRAKSAGFPVAGHPGALVAFPSKTAHEVTPVTCGERFSIVTWFV